MPKGEVVRCWRVRVYSEKFIVVEGKLREGRFEEGVEIGFGDAGDVGVREKVGKRERIDGRA